MLEPAVIETRSILMHLGSRLSHVTLYSNVI